MRIHRLVLLMVCAYAPASFVACSDGSAASVSDAASAPTDAATTASTSTGAAGSGPAVVTPEAGTAIAVIAPFGDGTVKGTAAFLKTGDEISLVVALNHCPDGTHAVHIHEGTSCADAQAQGGHWDMTRGEGIPDVVCTQGRGDAMTVRDASDPMLTWTIGGDPATSIVGHVFVVHGDGSDPATRIGCGPITVRLGGATRPSEPNTPARTSGRPSPKSAQRQDPPVFRGLRHAGGP